ncbi:MAG: MFS transporter [Hyphomicrobiaceae bacterium]
MSPNGLPALLQPRLSFYYGWLILACVCCAGFARQGPAVATLSIFVEPMTSEFGWSRTGLSAAVSLGGVLAALTSPILGPMLDRHGARVMLCVAVLLTGVCTMVLSMTQSLAFFIVFFCIARMNFAGPFELGIYGAINNWFLRLRGLATSISTIALMAGLIAMPLIAQMAIVYDGWRAGWIAVGAVVLLIGFIPNWLFMVRRPEDLGLVPDGAVLPAADHSSSDAEARQLEPAFTRAQALRTPAFWLLSLYTVLVFPVQAGVSLHQAPHLIERGIAATDAAFMVSAFSLASAVSGFSSGLLVRWVTVRLTLATSAIGLAAGAWWMIAVASDADGYISATLFGLGIGGVLTVLPLAWADYFGRQSFGAIRGLALSIQVLAQASGPMIAGILRDATSDYSLSLWVFTALAGVAAIIALLSAPPRISTESAASPV